jgi:GNAT superfamily N-acetyltransferase
MEVRRATLDDLPVLAPLFDAYRQFYGRPSDPGTAEAFLRERLTADESVIYLSLDRGLAIGFVQLYPTFWSVSARRAWILNDLFVAPKSRRTGAGRALLERARRHAVETGAAGLSLETGRENLTAQRLYESLGWRQEQEFHRYELHLEE